VFDHRDILGRLNDHIPLREKLITAHNSIKELFPFVARIAVTIYDPQTSVLKTFLHSSEDGDPMQHYQASIDDAPSLKEILKQGLPRVVNNLVTFEGGEHEHTQRIGRQGYAASYTMPMFNDGVFVGFLFFNSYDRDVFTEHVLREIDVYGHMIALMVINELTSIRTLTAAVQTTGHITHVRDAETGSHLDRMSRYCRLIATALAPKYHLDDDYIEHVFMFSPLHDIGKIGIPDRILLKPDKLDDAEWEIMKTHARKGREMIDKIVSNFGLENFRHMDVLRNIAEHHHECVNGSGYPDGRTRDQIPLEARIVAVADVFDALTSTRPYKEAWDNGRAIAMLRQLTGDQLDADCVEALIENMEKVEAIQRQFEEDRYG